MSLDLNLFVPALAGYVFLRLSNFTKFGILRASGYHLVFRSAVWGIGLYTVGWLLAARYDLTELLESWLQGEGWTQGRPAAYAYGINAAAAWSLLLALGAPLVLNRVYWAGFGARRAARKMGDFVDLLVDEASRDRRTLEISLNDGKTYVGYVTESRIKKYGAEDGALVLVPLFSGYRDRDTHELVLANAYAPLLLGDEAEKYWKELEVAVPRSAIRWVRLFDIALYRATQDSGRPRTIPRPQVTPPG